MHAGDWVVRMDQPFTALVRTVLAVQRYRADKAESSRGKLLSEMGE